MIDDARNEIAEDAIASFELTNHGAVGDSRTRYGVEVDVLGISDKDAVIIATYRYFRKDGGEVLSEGKRTYSMPLLGMIPRSSRGAPENPEIAEALGWVVGLLENYRRLNEVTSEIAPNTFAPLLAVLEKLRWYLSCGDEGGLRETFSAVYGILDVLDKEGR